MDAMRELFGIPKEGAHNALIDIYQEAEFICRFLRLKRYWMKEKKAINWDGALSDEKDWILQMPKAYAAEIEEIKEEQRNKDESSSD